MAAELSLAGAAGNIGTSMLWEGDRWPCSPTPLLSPWYAVHPLHLLLYRQPHTSGRKELVQLRWWEHRVCSVPCSHLCIIWGVLVGWQPHLCRAGTRSPPCPSGWCCCSRSGAGRSSSCREPRPQGGFQAWLSARIPHSHPVLALGGGRWTWAGSQVDFRQNNSSWIVLQAEVLLQVPMDSAKAWSPSSTVKHCLKIPDLQLAWLSAPMPSNLCTGEQRLHPATLCNAASTSTALL